MRKLALTMLLLLTLTGVARAGGMEDDPLLAALIVDRLEMRTADGSNPIFWDADAWIGKDLNKLWFKTEGEYRDQKIEEAEFQALYSRAVDPNWDLQAGVRRDTYQEPGMPDRNWLAVGFMGTAPYYFDVDTALFLGEDGRTSFRFKTEYEFMFTQRLVLVPEFELNAYGKNDPATRTGSGISETELGLRLRYEIRREFAPYVGINWNRLYGKTADYAKEEGADFDDVQFVIGVRLRF
ncbi:copper resistance protein B [Pseudodesulfovibrio cashew]|uniref:Copper resistance protein B n=1 Tax=Pseudodesulfovibrio cashew TaxID=2678688 RepID=A0A6I6JJS9_9BACT|nr:copper resistance protein B [Pseudodesulfovibrio cashew]QGY40562.1 copper resistance protein B [Pseudodesulfovibrio cashew]